MRRVARWSAALAAAALLLFSIATAWHLASLLMRPPWYIHPGPGMPLVASPLHDPITDFGLAYEDVAVPTSGGATLRGWLVGAQIQPQGAPETRSAVVLAGGGWSDRRTFHRQIPLLHDGGWPALYFDYREHGASDGAGRGATLGVREQADVSAAVAWMKETRGFARVAVVGYSMGAAAAILAAARDRRIDAVVAIHSGTTIGELLRSHPDLRGVPAWMLRLTAQTFLLRAGAPWRAVVSGDAGPLGVVDRIAPRPLLIMQSEQDEFVTVEQAQRLFARARDPKTLWIAPSGSHAGLLDVPTPAFEQALRVFLKDAIGVKAPGG